MSTVFFIFAVGVNGGLCRERLLTRVGSMVIYYNTARFWLDKNFILFIIKADHHPPTATSASNALQILFINAITKPVGSLMDIRKENIIL